MINLFNKTKKKKNFTKEQKIINKEANKKWRNNNKEKIHRIDKEIRKLRKELNRCIVCDKDLINEKFRTCLTCRLKNRNIYKGIIIINTNNKKEKIK